MIKEFFSTENITSVEFGVRLKNGSVASLPIDKSIQNLLIENLSRLVEIVDHAGAVWEAFNVSEEYGSSRLLFCPIADDLMKNFQALQTFGSMPKERLLREIIAEVDSYMVVYTDENKRRLIGIKKATRFKGLAGERNRFAQIFDNTLRLLQSDIFRIEKDFDVVICQDNVLILKTRAFEILAGLQEQVAAAAVARVESIEAEITYIDFSHLKETISKHARSARIATSVSKRSDLKDIRYENLSLLANAQKIKLIATQDGRFRPRVADQHKFLELLDDRRYISQLTGADVPFIARSRVKATD